MSDVLNLDTATELVKQLVDQIRCFHCDGVEGSRVRYPCGHSVCSTCYSVDGNCLVCLSPPGPVSPTQPTPDPVLSCRVEKTAAVFKTFQEAFHIDVDKRQRLSKQSKLERELFPECIQAENKYFNKRKTIENMDMKRRNNISSILTDENLWSPDKMGRVRKWLEESDPVPERLPFSDLNVNTPRAERASKRTTVKTSSDLILHQTEENSINNDNLNLQTTPRKRTYSRSLLSLSKNRQRIDNALKPVNQLSDSVYHAKRIKKENSVTKYDKNKIKSTDESGIVIDDDPIIIDDSLPVIDKDRAAWLEVLKTHDESLTTDAADNDLICDEEVKYTDEVECTVSKKEEKSTQKVQGIRPITVENKKPHATLSPLHLSPWLNSAENTPTTHLRHKVPFIKKGTLYKQPCKGSDSKPYFSKVETAGQKKKVAITVETDTFVTTISISDRTESKRTNISQSVQTDYSFLKPAPVSSESSYKPSIANKVESKITIIEDSDDLFTSEKIAQQKVKTRDAVKQKFMDFGSDNEINENSKMQVEAEVHSCTYTEPVQTVLTPLDSAEELPDRGTGMRTKRYVSSSNSSEKENRDPNRNKRLREKKLIKKPKRYT